MQELIAAGNEILGPVFVSRGCHLGLRNRFYPGVTLEAGSHAHLRVGNGNVFYPGTTMLAANGAIMIGDDNLFGPGGCTISTDAAEECVTIGSGGRYREGAVILAGASLGDGSQVLGPIQVMRCDLEPGAPFTHPDPQARGGVLKGSGRARSLVVGTGQVILGEGKFDQADLASQASFHPVGQRL